MNNYPLLFVVACALIRPAKYGNDGQVLLAQRPEGKNLAGLWEFPGGKLEAGERPEQALKRELYEELGITVAEADLQPINFASHAYKKFHLFMPLYSCKQFQGRLQSREGQSWQWVDAKLLAEDYQQYQKQNFSDQNKQLPLDASSASGAEQTDSTKIHYPLPPADIPLIPSILKILK